MSGSFAGAAQQGTSTILTSLYGPNSANPSLSGGAIGGISAGVGIFLALGMGLLAAHDQRYKNATTENDAVANAVPVFDADIKSIIKAANDGTIGESEAIQYLQETSNSYWSYIQQFKGPGIATVPCPPMIGGPAGAGACWKGPNCVGSKTCTVGCCIGCNVIEASLQNAMAIIQAGGGSFNVCKVYGNKYGLKTREGYTLTYSKPNLIAGTEGAISAFFNSFTGGSSPVAGNLSAQSKTAQVKRIGIAAGIAIAALFLFKKVL